MSLTKKFGYNLPPLIPFLGFFLCGIVFGVEIEDEFNTANELPALQNILQLTFSEDGFEKCGEAYFSPDAETIIFQAVPKGKEQYQIFKMDLSERIPRMVSTGVGACTCAYFRPDRQKIIFASSHEDPKLEENSGKVPGYQRTTGSYVWEFTPYMNIYEANPDGTELKALTSGPNYHAECAYSADGTRIVFASNVSGSMNIYTMGSDGGDVHQVTHTDHCYNGGPFFSPDGQTILYRADRDKPHYLDIYCCRADGSNERKLTSNGGVNWAPYWHPNGNVIAFTTSLHGHMHYEIYLLNIETGVQKRLTHNKTFDGLPVFSLDGNKIMWTSKRGKDRNCHIFMADFTLPLELK
ncbi:MAG: PD40 domain-containing protein [Parachlamydiaceae bacterium]|nr:PD40 domain-containing protein [Parachlamydiaceae bacterium]